MKKNEICPNACKAIRVLLPNSKDFQKRCKQHRSDIPLGVHRNRWFYLDKTNAVYTLNYHIEKLEMMVKMLNKP